MSVVIDNVLWIEKYRPKDYDDVIGLDKDFSTHVIKDVPNLILVGTPGIGKTTLAKIVCLKGGYEKLYLNASDERGIDVVRNKVKDFAITRSFNNKIKVVHLDEADRLTPEAQDMLRNLMEDYQANYRFILTGNNESLFTDAIASRCTIYRFGKTDKKDILARLIQICELEKVEYTEENLKKIVTLNYPDIRRCIKRLQELSIGGKVNDEEKGLNPEEFFELVKEKKFKDIRITLLNANVDHYQYVDLLFFYVIKHKDVVPYDKMFDFLEFCAETQYRMKGIRNTYVQFGWFVSKLMRLF